MIFVDCGALRGRQNRVYFVGQSFGVGIAERGFLRDRQHEGDDFGGLRLGERQIAAFEVGDVVPHAIEFAFGARAATRAIAAFGAAAFGAAAFGAARLGHSR